MQNCGNVTRYATLAHLQAGRCLLCRHNDRASEKLTDFDDIAMILHNSTSGVTCFFQTENGEVAFQQLVSRRAKLRIKIKGCRSSMREGVEL